jgi:ABC-type nitrate/sulfonate/bicarbonate transport system substrate-binding protein
MERSALVPRRILASLVFGLMVVGCAGADEGAAPMPDPLPEADADVADAPLAEVTLLVLEAPSQASFLQPIIESQGLAERHGLDLTFVPKAPPALVADFVTDESVVSGSGAFISSVLLPNERGVDTVLLFNTFDFWGTVVVEEGSDIRTFEDLEGRDLVAALSSANYAMFQILADQSGADLSLLTPQNADTSGLVAAARSGNFDAVQLWEPAHSVLIAGAPPGSFRTIDVVGAWQAATGLARIPYIGVAAHRSWYEANPELAVALYRVYADAAEFIRTDPAGAAQVISEATSIDAAILEELFRSDRHRFAVYPAIDALDSFQPIADGAHRIGLTEEPIDPASVIVPLDLS